MSGPMDHRDRLYARYVTVGALDVPGRAALEGRAPYLRKVIRRFFPDRKDAAILDLGCGHGALLHVARQMGFTRLRGIDGSPEQVALARTLGIDGVEQGDVLEGIRATPAETLDVVVAFDLLEHLEPDVVLQLLDACHRALRPGGCLLLHVPNAESPFFGRIRYGDFTHQLAFTAGSMAQVLRSTGFADVVVLEDRPLVHGLMSAARRVVYETMRVALALFLAAETGSTRFVLSQNLLAVAKRPGS